MLIQFFIQTVLYYQFWKHYFQKTFMKWYVHTDSSSSKKNTVLSRFGKFYPNLLPDFERNYFYTPKIVKQSRKICQIVACLISMRK
jgi:hypothetical protein